MIIVFEKTYLQEIILKETISTATVTWAVLIAFYYNQIDHLSTTPQVSSCRSQSLYRDSRHPRVDP